MSTLASTDETPVGFLLGIWQKILAFLASVSVDLLTIVVIIIAAWLLSRFLRLAIRRVVRRVVDTAKVKASVDDTQALERSPLADIRLVQRTRTLGTILQNMANVIIGVIALILCINAAFPNLLGSFALLTAAVGAGLGFGAQNIVKDVLNGIFIVAEDQVGIGDVVDVGLATGVVEYVSVRVTHVRDVNGTLWYVRNGEIMRIGNMSQGWARAIIDVGVPADADVPAVEEAMLKTAKTLAADPKWRTRILEAPEVWGLETVDGDTLVIRIVIRTRTNAKDDVAQELRMRLRTAVHDLGLDLPRLASVIPEGLEGARRVRGANPPTTRPSPVTGVPPARGLWKRKSADDHRSPPPSILPPKDES